MQNIGEAVDLMELSDEEECKPVLKKQKTSDGENCKQLDGSTKDVTSSQQSTSKGAISNKGSPGAKEVENLAQKNNKPVVI